MSDAKNSLPKELLFLQVVSMFQMAAMQQLGKLMDPVSGEVQRDLEQAKISIDILDVLKEKTQGNLTENEEEFLKKVLFELHMNYVEELKRPAEEQPDDGNGSTAGDESSGKDRPADEEEKA